ncbi:MAG TPA: hypothetical protein VM142_08450 [Acidimicrobiales bacterium]|nr:hypothetical protein [Acidimicrobiales bacterium]
MGGGVAAVVMSAGAVAWACTPYPDGESFGNTPEAPMESQDRSADQPQPQPEAQVQPETQTVTAPSAAAAPAPAPAATSNLAKTSRSTRTASVAPARRTPPRPAVADAAPVEATTAPVAEAMAPVADPLPSMSSVAGDLWSGFSAVPSTATRGPGLATPVPVAAEPGSEWVVGMGLLGAGLVALGAGTAVSVVRRSRVRVDGGSR